MLALPPSSGGETHQQSVQALDSEWGRDLSAELGSQSSPSGAKTHQRSDELGRPEWLGKNIILN